MRAPTLSTPVVSTPLAALILWTFLTAPNVLCLGERSAHAQGLREPDPPVTVVYASDKTLWAWTKTPESAELEELGAMPFAASDLERVLAAGDRIVVQAHGIAAWAPIQLRDGQPKLGDFSFFPCDDLARISKDRRHLLCGSTEGTHALIYSLERADHEQAAGPILIAAPSRTGEVYFGPETETAEAKGSMYSIVFASEGSLWQAGPDSRKRVAPVAPSGAFAVTPTGERAVATYRDGEINVVFALLLDDKGIKRTLMHVAQSVAISPDSAWAAIQQDRDACAARIVGGQFMCWRKFRALGIGQEGAWLLMRRAERLVVGRVSGTSARAPFTVADPVTGAATLWQGYDSFKNAR